VLDVPQADLSEGDAGGVTVRYATRKGRDAADDRIRGLLEDRLSAPVVVVTSDRALASDVRGAGAHVEGAGTLLRRLDAAGC
jgi:predicted RNA-binding protein with PIN domain